MLRNRILSMAAPAATAILALLVFALLSGWPAQAQQATQEVWTGNMTVGTMPGNTSHGFSPLVGGSLSSTTFTFLGDDYEIIGVTGPIETSTEETLHLIFRGGMAGDKADRDLLLLRLEEGTTVRTYNLSTANTLEVNDDSLGGMVTALEWPTTFAHLGWEAGDVIKLTLDRINREATGAPSITGTPKVGQNLSVDTTGIDDLDGIADATFTYQWILSDGTVDQDIDGGPGHRRSDRLRLRPHRGTGRQLPEGPGRLHRRRRLRGEPDQRGHRRH